MTAIPSKVASRLVAGIKRFQPILVAAKARDVNESDTVVIVTDMLQDVFGYDKYTEITSEHAIRGTYCDLAIKIDGTLAILIEVKSIGMDLKDQFVKQAVDYAANQGVDWVILTSGMLWRVYKVSFTKPIDHELMFEFDFAQINPRNNDDIELAFMLAKESWKRALLSEYHAQKQALSRFTLAAIVLGESALELIRRELRRVTPGIKIETSEIRKVLEVEVLKREVVEGEKAVEAQRRVSRAGNKMRRNGKVKSADTDGAAADPTRESVAVASDGLKPDVVAPNKTQPK